MDDSNESRASVIKNLFVLFWNTVVSEAMIYRVHAIILITTEHGVSLMLEVQNFCNFVASFYYMRMKTWICA
jgi:hypothetical protein